MLSLNFQSSISNIAFHEKKKAITICNEIKPFSMHKHKLIPLNTLKNKHIDGNKLNGEYNIDSSLSSDYNRKSRRSNSSLLARANEKSRSNFNIIDELPQDLRPEAMPRHVALIMDGNKRWAEEKGVPTQQGHYTGLEKLKGLISSCCRLGIRVLSAYAFSTENWSRPKEEVDFIMKATEELIRSHIMELANNGNGLRFSVVGDKSRLPQSLRSAITLVEESSKNNKGLHFVIALNYSGRYEIIEAVKKISEKIKDGTLRNEDINSEVFEQQLETAMLPEPDLLIRTSGELRISNFMLWQLAYAELYFCDKWFPDFEEEDLIEAIRSFQKRKRRFGGRKLEQDAHKVEY